MKNSNIAWALALILSFNLSGCGSGSPSKTAEIPYADLSALTRFDSDMSVLRFNGVKTDYPKTVSTKTLPADERAKYCYVEVEQESQVGSDEFLGQLRGVWKMVLAPGSWGWGRKVFSLDPDSKVLAQYSEGSSPKNYEQISYERICVSKPLPATHRYSGFRVVEVKSNQNDGVVAMAVKFVNPTGGRTNPTLWVTDYEYQSYFGPNQNEVIPLNALFTPRREDESSRSIYVYPIRE